MQRAIVPPDIEWHIRMDNGASESDAAYIDALIRMTSQKLRLKLTRVLDAPCGNGRLHRYLIKYGYSVYGVDINKALIKQAKEAHPANAGNYFVGDIRNFNLKREFDVYISWFTSLGYFEDFGNLAVLRNAARHLKRHGIIIIDLGNREATVAALLTNPNAIFYNERDGYAMIERPKIEVSHGVSYQVRNESFYRKRGKNLIFVKRHTLERLRLYSEEDLRRQLCEAGFKPIYTFSGKSFTNFRRDAKRIVMIAMKR
jgi:SAM-dependent methyltransferase